MVNFKQVKVPLLWSRELSESEKLCRFDLLKTRIANNRPIVGKLATLMDLNPITDKEVMFLVVDVCSHEEFDNPTVTILHWHDEDEVPDITTGGVCFSFLEEISDEDECNLIGVGAAVMTPLGLIETKIVL